MTIDINVTSTCNLGCKYCSEGHNPEMPDLAKIENSKTDVKTEHIIDFIARAKARNPQERFTIAFWGGEPMMNMKYCMDIMIYYRDDITINFFFYTNGFYIKRYREEIKNIHNLLGHNRVEIQVSYDGKAVNDVERLTKQNQSTVEQVKEGFAILQELGIKSSFKSTVTPRTFKHMYESFVDIITTPGALTYFPTPESFTDYDPETEEEYFNDLRENLMKIANYIYQHKLPANSFGWFRNNKDLCSTGINYYGINLDGKMSPCHATMYDDYDDHEIGDLRDEDIFEKLDNMSNKFKGLLNHMNDDCVGCESLFCMKCPAGSYKLPSTIETVKHKMSDFTQNKFGLSEYDLKWTTKNINMCRVFKMNDIIYKALLAATQQTPVRAETKRCEMK